jgi:hypothetical protein
MSYIENSISISEWIETNGIRENVEYIKNKWNISIEEATKIFVLRNLKISEDILNKSICKEISKDNLYNIEQSYHFEKAFAISKGWITENKNNKRSYNTAFKHEQIDFITFVEKHKTEDYTLLSEEDVKNILIDLLS